MKKESKKLAVFNWAIILFLLFVSSCKSPYKSYSLVENKTPKTNFPSVLKNQKDALIFKSSIQYKDFHFGGLAVIQPLEDHIFRMAFTTKTGTKVLDITLDKTHMNVHYALNLLKRKPILKLLENDLRLLLDNVQVQQPETLKAPSFQENIYRLKYKYHTRHYYLNSDETLSKIELGTKRKPKVILTLENYQNGLPESVTFAHQNLNLTIQMNLIQKQ